MASECDFKLWNDESVDNMLNSMTIDDVIATQCHPQQEMPPPPMMQYPSVSSSPYKFDLSGGEWSFDRAVLEPHHQPMSHECGPSSPLADQQVTSPSSSTNGGDSYSNSNGQELVVGSQKHYFSHVTTNQQPPSSVPSGDPTGSTVSSGVFHQPQYIYSHYPSHSTYHPAALVDSNNNNNSATYYPYHPGSTAVKGYPVIYATTAPLPSTEYLSSSSNGSYSVANTDGGQALLYSTANNSSVPCTTTSNTGTFMTAFQDGNGLPESYHYQMQLSNDTEEGSSAGGGDPGTEGRLTTPNHDRLPRLSADSQFMNAMDLLKDMSGDNEAVPPSSTSTTTRNSTDTAATEIIDTGSSTDAQVDSSIPDLSGGIPTPPPAQSEMLAYHYIDVPPQDPFESNQQFVHQPQTHHHHEQIRIKTEPVDVAPTNTTNYSMVETTPSSTSTTTVPSNYAGTEQQPPPIHQYMFMPDGTAQLIDPMTAQVSQQALFRLHSGQQQHHYPGAQFLQHPQLGPFQQNVSSQVQYLIPYNPSASLPMGQYVANPSMMPQVPYYLHPAPLMTTGHNYHYHQSVNPQVGSPLNQQENLHPDMHYQQQHSRHDELVECPESKSSRYRASTTSRRRTTATATSGGTGSTTANGQRKAIGRFTTSGEKIRRPPNAFMIFAKKHRRDILYTNRSLSNKQVSKILGTNWHNLDEETRRAFQEESEILRTEHQLKYPGYYYSPLEARRSKEERKLQQAERLQTKRQESSTGASGPYSN